MVGRPGRGSLCKRYPKSIGLRNGSRTRPAAPHLPEMLIKPVVYGELWICEPGLSRFWPKRYNSCFKTMLQTQATTLRCDVAHRKYPEKHWFAQSFTNVESKSAIAGNAYKTCCLLGFLDRRSRVVLIWLHILQSPL